MSGESFKTVLIVEDEELLRSAVSNALRKMGHAVLEAADGTMALEIIRTHPGEIDAILLDLTLPGASSGQVLTEAGLRRPGAMLIVTSAHSSQTAQSALPGHRIAHFLRKPYRVSELVALIAPPAEARTP